MTDEIDAINKRAIEKRESDLQRRAKDSEMTASSHGLSLAAASRSREVLAEREACEQIASAAAVDKKFLLHHFTGRPEALAAFQDACNLIALRIRSRLKPAAAAEPPTSGDGVTSPDYVMVPRELAEEVASDLENEIDGRYTSIKDQPSQRRRWDRDMDLVRRFREAMSAAPPSPRSDENQIFIHTTPKCEHEFAGWREFDDGNGGEQVCNKCGVGAMSASLRDGP